jgi:hypothetical protein
MNRGMQSRGRVKIHRFFLIFIIVILAFSLLPTSSAVKQDEQSSKTRQDEWRAKVTIELVGDESQDAIEEIRVGPGDLRSAIFKGKVYLDTQGGPGKHIEQIWMLLYADIEEPGWDAQVIPPMISFPYADTPGTLSYDIYVQVVAPFRAPVQTHEIMVTGLWSASPAGFSGQAYANLVKVRVAQFPDLILDAIDVLVETSPGATVDFELQVRNRGNDFDDFTITLENGELLGERGWAITIPNSTIHDIPSWGYKTVKVKVRSPQKFTPWKNQVTEIIIKVESDSGVRSDYAGLGIKDFSFFFYERGTYIPPEPTICIITGLIVLVVVVVWYRKRSYKKWLKEKDDEEGEDEDEEDDDS